MKAKEVELILSKYFDPRRNLIVPNVSWAMFRYEMDMVVVRPSGYAAEVEIKVSLSDIIADKRKTHGHQEPRIRNLYFAIPEELLSKAEPHIPEEAGILVICGYNGGHFVLVKRQAKDRCKYKFSEKEMLQLAKNGVIKLWSCKRKLLEGEG